MTLMTYRASTRVGTLLGDGKPVRARQASFVSILLISCLMLINSSLIIGLRKQLSYVFTSNEEVVAISSKLLIVAGLSTV